MVTFIIMSACYSVLYRDSLDIVSAFRWAYLERSQTDHSVGESSTEQPPAEFGGEQPKSPSNFSLESQRHPTPHHHSGLVDVLGAVWCNNSTKLCQEINRPQLRDPTRLTSRGALSPLQFRIYLIINEVHFTIKLDKLNKERPLAVTLCPEPGFCRLSERKTAHLCIIIIFYSI